MLKTQRVDRFTGTLRVAANAIQLAGHRARRKNRRTLLREAEADIAHAKDGTEILDCLYVMETGMRYFFMRAQAARSVKGNEAVVRANMLEAVSIAEKIAPYRHHRLAAIKVASPPCAAAIRCAPPRSRLRSRRSRSPFSGNEALTETIALV